jgi:tetratricopeptide (TPR) repeat protein
MLVRLIWALSAVAGIAFGQAPVLAQDALQKAETLIQAEDFQAAEPLLRKLLQDDPGHVEALYRLGYLQYRQRRLAEARRSFSSIVKTAPPAYYSRYFLGRIALLENNPREAIEWLEPVAASGQAIFDAVSQLAAAYAGAGEPRKAVAALRQAIDSAPWDGALYYRLGQLYRQLGQAELAQEAFESSRRLKDASREDVEVIMKVSQALQQGNAVEARRLGSRLLDRPNADPNALVALGVVYGGAGQPQDALRAFERAAEGDTNLFQAHFNQGLALLKAGRSADALAPLSRAASLLPQSFEANLSYGLALVMNQKYAEAVAPLEQARNLDAGNPRVASLLGTAYLRTGETAKAAPLLKSASESDPRDPSPLLLLVEALNAAEDPEGALEAAELARSRFPSLPQAHMAAAQQLARMGRYQDATPGFEQVLKLAPGHPEAELGMADTLQRSGQYERALPHYRAAMKSGSTVLAARLGLARSLIALRRLPEARQVLEEGLREAPNDLALRVELSRVYARLGEAALAAEQSRIAEQIRTAQTPQ